MKKRIIQLALLSIIGIISSQVHAQMVINIVNTNEVLNAEPIDEALFTARYEMTMLHDTVKPDSRQEETMMLKVGKTASQFYSYTKYMADSLIADARSKGAGPETMTEIVKQYVPKITYQIFKNYPSGKVTTLDRLAMSNFRCEEENEKPVWNILPDTMTLMTYPCQKAVCHFKGRDYEAWFTPDIPRSEGPWKLYGLPGLILKVRDSEGHYTFECTAISNNQGETITYGGKEFEPLSRKDLNKVYKRYVADPVGFISSMAPNVKVTIKGEDGQPAKNPKDIPYNPIELE